MEKIPIFLSYPQPYLKKQEIFINKLNEYLREKKGLDPRTLGVTDYNMKAPLIGIRELMNASNGLIAIAFRRSKIEEGWSKPESDLGKTKQSLNGKWLTSPYCHIEPAMAFQLELPILIIRESDVLEEGILEKGVTGSYMPEFSLTGQTEEEVERKIDSYFESKEWEKLIKQWTRRVEDVFEEKNIYPKRY